MALNDGLTVVFVIRTREQVWNNVEAVAVRAGAMSREPELC